MIYISVPHQSEDKEANLAGVLFKIASIFQFSRGLQPVIKGLTRYGTDTYISIVELVLKRCIVPLLHSFNGKNLFEEESKKQYMNMNAITHSAHLIFRILTRTFLFSSQKCCVWTAVEVAAMLWGRTDRTLDVVTPLANNVST